MKKLTQREIARLLAARATPEPPALPRASRPRSRARSGSTGGRSSRDDGG